ncbi:MAG: hypothetical protein H6833_04685 [Planctomycetes bacterium]|nr:hypothetical protein [Planctomycetota bacterium]
MSKFREQRPGVSRDPRVIFTGRENLRLIILGVAGLLFLTMALILPKIVETTTRGSAVDSEELPAQANEELRSAHAELVAVPKEIQEVFAGIDLVDREHPLTSGQNSVLAGIARRLESVPETSFRALDAGDVRALVEAESRPALRGGLYRIYGPLAFATSSVKVGLSETVWGVIYPEVGPGELLNRPVHFCAKSLLAETSDPWEAGTWVTLYGYYVTDLQFPDRYPGMPPQPLLVSGRVATTVESRLPPEEIFPEELNLQFAMYDRYFATKENNFQALNGNPQIPLEPRDEMFGLALAAQHEPERFADAEVFVTDMIPKLNEDPQSQRGKRFKLRGEIGLLSRIPFSNSRYRIEAIHDILLVIGQRVIRIMTPLDVPFEKGDVVEIDAWFLTEHRYRAEASGKWIDRPLFVAAGIHAWSPDYDRAGLMVHRIIVIAIVGATVFLCGMFWFFLFRDGKRSRDAQAKVIEIRRKRRERGGERIRDRLSSARKAEQEETRT